MVFIAINVLHVSGGSYAHHQELKTVYTASGICRAFTAPHCYRELEHDSAKKQNKLDKYMMLFIQFWAPEDGRMDSLKHVDRL